MEGSDVDAADERRIAALVNGLSGYAQASTITDALKAAQAVDALRETSLPKSYVDGIEDELMRIMGQKLRQLPKVSVYLAFYGEGDRADYMKVGVSKNVHARMKGIRTGNPLPLLYLYSVAMDGRRRALSVESAILDHVEGSRITGEWAKLGRMSEGAVEAVVASLGEVASQVTGQQEKFKRHGVYQ